MIGSGVKIKPGAVGWLEKGVIHFLL